MDVTSTQPCPLGPCELRFQSLFDAGRSYAFPCDAAGRVDMDALSDKARENYLYCPRADRPRTRLSRRCGRAIATERAPTRT